jgi:hypothetical protein
MIPFAVVAVVLFVGTILECMYISRRQHELSDAARFCESTQHLWRHRLPDASWETWTFDRFLHNPDANVELTCGRCGSRRTGDRFVPPLIRKSPMRESMRLT